MDTNYRANIAKWLPLSDGALNKWLIDASLLDEKIGKLAGCIALIIKDSAEAHTCDQEVSFIAKIFSFLLSINI